MKIKDSSGKESTGCFEGMFLWQMLALAPPERHSWCSVLVDISWLEGVEGGVVEGE